MFGLEQKYIDFIIKTLNENLPDKNVEYYIFGSRAKNNFAQYSDIDIALNGKEKIKIDILDKISIIFNNSTLPYEIDIIDLNSIDENFKNIIKKDLKRIN